MKYNLQGFSQEVACELNIDGIDLYLLRWFVDFKDTNQMDTKIVDGEVYYWIYHKKVSEDMPILNMKKTAIYRRLKKLCKAQIFKKTVIRERGTFTYYAIGPNYIRLISNTPNSGVSNVSALKLPSVSPDFDDDNLCCDALASSFDLPTEGFDKISKGLMPLEESDIEFQEGAIASTTGDIKSQGVSLKSYEGAIESTTSSTESYQGAIESTRGSFESYQGALKSSQDISESIISPSKLTLNDENLTFKQKTDTFKAKEGSFESDRGAFESDQKIEINNNNIYNSSNSENKETTSENKEITLSELLWKFIKELNPTFPLPNFKKWIRDFKNILYKDKYDFDEVSEVIEWTFTNEDNRFWTDKIVEASDLRRHYKRILAQFNSAKRALKNKISTSRSYYNTVDFIEF